MPPFGGLRGNVHGSSMARWKARCRLPISALALTVEAQILVEISLLERGWVTLSANFRGKVGRPPTNFGVRKLQFLGYHVVLFA